MLKDYFALAVQSMRHRHIRSWLTMLGIVVGVAAIVSLIALGQGLENSINEEFEKIGVDFITIMPGSSGGVPGMGFGAAKLEDGDVRVIERIKEVDIVSPMMTSVEKVTYGNEERYTYVSGMVADDVVDMYFNKKAYQIVEGRVPRATDRWKAIAGYKVSKDFFGKALKPGAKVEIKERDFKIVGIMEEIGNSQDDTQFLIALEDAKIIYDREDYDVIMVVPKKGQDAEEVAEKIKKELEDYRDEEDFQVFTSKQMLESFNSVLGIVQVILVGVAAISLIVGGIGIMNSMYTSVLERTKEIGILKAIGATNNHILSIFLVEAGMMGAGGGIVGVLIGMGIGKIVEIAAVEALGTTYLKVCFGPELIAFSIGFAFVVGCLSGLLPARNAANMDPVMALRYE